MNAKQPPRAKGELSDHEYFQIAESGPHDPMHDPEYCRRKVRRLYTYIWFTLGPAKARQIFLGALDSKRSVREHASADLLRRYLSSGQGLGKFAATVAAECGKKAETVQAAIIRAQKRMRKDKDFEALVRFLTGYHS